MYCKSVIEFVNIILNVQLIVQRRKYCEINKIKRYKKKRN